VFAVATNLCHPTVGLQLKILQKFQNEYLRTTVNAFSYVINDILHDDLNVRYAYVKDEIKRYASQRYAMKKHLNILATNFMKQVKTTRRLKRKLPQDLCTRSFCNFIEAILKPIWAYGVQLRGTVSSSNIKVQRFQNRYLRIVNVNLGTSSMTLYIMISTCRMLKTRLKNSARDMPIEGTSYHAINFMKQVKTTRRLKTRLLQDLCT